jgi:ParB/RepB/Spo0J family partition protein
MNRRPRKLPTPRSRKHPVSDIRIGVRHRRDLGDIDELARSIDEVGLLHPIVVRSDGRLIAGERRLAACKRLGWQRVPVTVVDLRCRRPSTRIRYY